MPPSRREILLGTLASWLLGDQELRSAPDTDPHIVFPRDGRDRLSVTSYPFRAFIESPTNRERKPELPGMDLKQFPAMVRDRFGIRNINPLGNHFRSVERTYLEELGKAVSDAGSHIVDLGLGGGSFYSPDSTARETSSATCKRWIDIASNIGSPSVRQHVKGAKGDRPNVDLAARELAALAEYGAKRKVVINLENDNPVAEDPFFLAAVIAKADHPYLRALPDFGNSLIDHDAAFNERAVRAMLPHAFNICHVKDTVVSQDGRKQIVDLKQMFGLAKASGFKGYFSMECETQADDPFTGTKRLAAETLQYLA